MTIDRQRFRLLRFWILILCVVAALAAPAAAEDTVEGLLGAKALRNATTAFVVWDLNTSQSLYAQNIDKMYIPASNMKIITAAAALLQLGSEYQFKTEFYASNWQPGTGTAQDLVVWSNGDPTFSDEFFDTAGSALDAIAQNLKRSGLNAVAGNIVLDGTAFSGPDYPDTWPKEDKAYCYGARTQALSVTGNCFKLTVTGGGKAGDPPIVSADPPLFSGLTKNNVKTVSKGKNWVSVSIASDGVVTIKGQVRPGKSASAKMPVNYPDALLGNGLAAALARNGISFSGKLVRVQNWGGNTQNLTPIASIGSPLLSVIIAEMLKESDNFVAEMLMRTLGRERGGEGSTKAGTQVALDALYQFGIASPGTIKIYDGSGLSRSNRLTPRVLMQLLRNFYNSYLGATLIKALAEPGGRGTLKKRMVGTDVEGRLWAKTGALRGVCALSGYYIRPNGNVGAFTMLMNGYSVHSDAIRDIQDRLALVMYGM